MKKMSLRSLTILAGSALALVTGAAQAQQTIYAIGNGGSSLVSFQSNNPANVTLNGNFTLNGTATFLDAIDFRPATNQLYGYLDSTDSFYTVDTSTGALTLASVGASGAPTNTFHVGIDFNPTIDRLRAVTDSGQNIVFNPVAGTAAAFTTLAYAAGDINETANPSIIDNAYTNNFAGAATSQQYAIDYGTDSLVTLANNAGTLVTVGSLGVNTDLFTGFDITTVNGVNTAYAILTPANGLPSLYTINLQTGSATSVGALGFTNQVYSLAIATIPAPGAGAMLAMGLLASGGRSRRR